MSKGKRLRDRRAKATAKASVHPPLEWLLIANEIVGDVFGPVADCAVAAALLKSTGDLLGFNLTPRPVSLYAYHRPTDSHAFVGPKAEALVPESERHRMENQKYEGRDTGHMILTSETPMVLLDPNLRQLAVLGIDAPSITVNILSTNPPNGRWEAKPPGFDLDLLYLLDDNDALWERYESALVTEKSNAEALAAQIRSGRSYEQISIGLRPRFG